MNEQQKRETIEALYIWLGVKPNDGQNPESVMRLILEELNGIYNLHYTKEDIRHYAPLILAWLRDPSIIDEDHDDSEQWIRKHHG